MIYYNDTLLWNLTLAEKNDKHEVNRRMLRNSFLDIREKVSGILEQIRNDFPNLTLHDISHADSLWQTASVIIGNNYPINPMEGYILGCTFLLHDAALSYDAFGGVESLRETITWRDCFADISKKTDSHNPEKVKSDADFWAIRLMHADESKSLLFRLFERDDHSSFYLLEDSSLREHLGQLIGNIAASHHWSYEELNTLKTQKNSMVGFPREWRVNPVKLACILRCADAAHIDNGRAPDHLFRILRFNGISYEHWKAQNYLAQIDCDQNDIDKIIITSTKDFVEDEFAAWNVAYDAITVLKNELKESNKLLKSIDPLICFQAKEVTGASSREELSKYITVKGWNPCETRIQISDITELIKKLGGSNLYGEYNQILVVFRELIQNARDAIKARENYDRSFQNGEIIIEVNELDNEFWVSLSDNGIGMSQRTLISTFLDFGTSFWASDLARIEFPGLRSSSFESIGKFGIGFYSVFMVASYVEVESRRFDQALDDTSILKFPTGITLNPILSQKRSLRSDVSTTVKIRLDKTKYTWNEEYEIDTHVIGEKDFMIPFSSVLKAMCAGLDVNVKYKGVNSETIIIHTDIESEHFDKKQWLMDIFFAKYNNNQDIIKYINENFHRLEYIKNDNKIVGLAALSTFKFHANYLSKSTIGGLTTNLYSGSGDRFIGFMDNTTDMVSRSGERKLKADRTVIEDWVLRQKKILLSENLDEEKKYHLQHALCMYGVDPIDICSVFITNNNKNTELISLENLVNKIKYEDKKLIILQSNFSGNYVEINYDVEDIYPKLTNDDFLYTHKDISDFLKLEFENKVPVNNFSFIDCLYRKSKMMDCNISFSIIEDYAPSEVGMCRGIVIHKG